MDAQAIQSQIDAITFHLERLREMIGDAGLQPPVFPQSAVKDVNAKICLNCGKSTKGKRVVRGCDEACHRQVMRAIEAGEFTDDEAVRRGLLTPKQKGGRKPKADTKLAQIRRGKESEIDEDLRIATSRAAEAKSEYTAKTSTKKKTTKKKSG